MTRYHISHLSNHPTNHLTTHQSIHNSHKWIQTLHIKDDNHPHIRHSHLRHITRMQHLKREPTNSHASTLSQMYPYAKAPPTSGRYQQWKNQTNQTNQTNLTNHNLHPRQEREYHTNLSISNTILIHISHEFIHISHDTHPHLIRYHQHLTRIHPHLTRVFQYESGMTGVSSHESINSKDSIYLATLSKAQQNHSRISQANITSESIFTRKY